MIAAARAMALLRGRDYVLPGDVEELLRDAFRHRLVLSYQALAEEVSADRVLDEVLAAVAAPQIDLRPPRDRGGVKRRSRLNRRRGRTRTPARPGPGSSAPRASRRSSLSIGRRVDGLLAGDYRSAFAGVGSELYQVRPYEAGDDVRRIDWNVTARTGETHVRVELAERVLVTWLVYDASASMSFGTKDRRKADVAEGVALAVGHAASRRGNRLGLVAFGAGGPEWRRPRQGRRGLLVTLGAIRDDPSGDGSLGQALALLDGLAVQRSLVVIVSDFRGPIDWRQPLLRIAGRHPTVAVEIRDPREQELADVGELRLVDPETGRQLRVDTSDRGLRERFAEAAGEERRNLVRLLSSVGVRHVALSTEGDWLRALAAFLRRSER